MDYRYLIIPAILVLFIIIFLILFHFKKKAVIKKVNALSPHEKEQLLDTLAKPVGYMYDPNQDIFTAGLPAPRKIFGYTTFYDLAAPYFNMIFDYETIYFNYNSTLFKAVDTKDMLDITLILNKNRKGKKSVRLNWYISMTATGGLPSLKWALLQSRKTSVLIPLSASKTIPCCISSLIVLQKHYPMQHTAQTIPPYFSPFITAIAGILSSKERFAVSPL
ncbi:MAG: DUF4474 domain-containing protein [Lachnospiraceae bacterium]|nr:DUF4474 domain-containing protein [Lachnospiraceae bacterium]